MARTGRPRTVSDDEKRVRNVRACMLQRCTNPKNPAYPNYGGRGIAVCEEWTHDSKAFCEWAFESGYQQGLSIDRIDNNGDYCPENCRWATRKQQARNTRKNVVVTIEGETHPYSEWAEIFGIDRSLFHHRMKSGWDLGRVVNEPAKEYFRRNKIPIEQYSADGEFIRRWDSAKDVERETGMARGAIRDCCNGKRRTSYGYIWKDA